MSLAGGCHSGSDGGFSGIFVVIIIFVLLYLGSTSLSIQVGKAKEEFITCDLLIVYKNEDSGIALCKCTNRSNSFIIIGGPSYPLSPEAWLSLENGKTLYSMKIPKKLIYNLPNEQRRTN